jgi:hypothetical protein
MLPIPKDPNFQTPEVSEEEFNNPSGPEDESLIDTGAFDDYIENTPEALAENVMREIEGLKEALVNKNPTK